ncbi:RagB/SusD family nutrient uptake outer membrane protein [Ferruginibacter albus]|uniref:RagB/SusD family nutrient uptake outer membrane protein n=1 Tax=Ferruginibacter albus TaxID=2875540 RepID=UPI001CC4E256|nr:RagB/SusD family nutrient uptake outer membrane protein [Ferruginibacter albus]UAY50958.1 RagB/SusD family nutrient uptake outer membrane protein [Ferruginibacter albus]
MIKKLLLFYIFVIPVVSFSQTCIWIGVTDTASWANPANWSCGKVPDSASDVFILGDSLNKVKITQNAVCYNIGINTLNAIADVRPYLDNAYTALKGDEGYGIRLSIYYTQSTDETIMALSNVDDNDRRSISRYTVSDSNYELQRPFSQLYKGIVNANLCITIIPRMLIYQNGANAEKAELKRMYGEALTLKAQLLFELIRNWGDVPETSVQYYHNNLDVYNQNTNRDTIYSHLLNDLALAETLLPWRSQVTALGDPVDERITLGAAKALRAKIALFAGGYSLRSDSVMRRPVNYLPFYQIAKQECEDLMNKRTEHTLNPSYIDVWKNTICGHKVDDGFGEIIFQVGMSDSLFYGMYSSKFGYTNGPKVNTYGDAFVLIMPTYFYSFNAFDKRRDITCAPYDVDINGYKTGTKLVNMRDGKFRRDWISNPVIAPTDVAQYFGLNWPLIRFSDVLLMYAEADNEINGAPSTKAIKAFEEVRKRGFGADSAAIGITPTDKDGFFNAIVNERSWELGAEGIRKYDLIRWNLLGQKIEATRSAITAMQSFQIPYDNLPASLYYNKSSTADDSTLWSTSFYQPSPATAPANTSRVNWINTGDFSTLLNSFAAGFTSNKNELLPYYIATLIANPSLKQNPGY